jgi:hypothetical protein
MSPNASGVAARRSALADSGQADGLRAGLRRRRPRPVRISFCLGFTNQLTRSLFRNPGHPRDLP